MVLGLNGRAAWRTAYASVIGTAHLKSGAPCQDAGRCTVILAADGSEILVAAASDGAGSAARSEIGADLAVEAFIAEFGAVARDDPTLSRIDRGFVTGWIARFQEALAARASAEGCAPSDFACTLLGAVVTASDAVYLQIGDGAIIVGTEEPDRYAWIAWPQHGEYANVTNFVTEAHATEVAEFEKGPAIDELALFTDGIERLVLDSASRSVHAPAFLPVFAWLRTTNPGCAVAPSEALTAYLGSAHVNARTDDDKTLVMATRRSVAPHGAQDGSGA